MLKTIRAVERLFFSVDKKINKFKEKTGLFCTLHCVSCCNKNDIETTITEFLPLAYYLYKNQKALEILEKLEQNHQNVCIFLDSAFSIENSTGGCSIYNQRGLLCRLFGFSAYLDKSGTRKLLTCSTIKKDFNRVYTGIEKILLKRDIAPLMRDYYMRLYSIDIQNGNKFYPINKAIRLAIEKVLFYFGLKGGKHVA